MKGKYLPITQFKDVIDTLSPCMDDYLYLIDFRNDYYYISPSALDRFSLEKNEFHNVMEEHKKVVYPDDFGKLCADLEELRKGEKDFHNLQYRWIDHEGNPVWINCRGKLICTDDGEPAYLVGCINEIARNKKADNVSGLLGEQTLRREFEAQDGSKRKGFLLMIGIDEFRAINESKGMDYGNMVLRRTADCIRKEIEPGQELYRAIADEFVITDFRGTDVAEAIQLYEKIRKVVRRFIEENKYEVVYTLSAGIVKLTGEEEQNYVNMMKLLEFAMNEAKGRGRNTYYIYEEKDYKAFLRKRELIRILRHSVNDNFNGFEVYYQPIVDIKERKLSSAESLLRFHTEELGMVSPVEFIPLLEESGLIIPVGQWVLEQAMAACKKIQEKMPDFRVSVNLSYIQVLKSNVLGEILTTVMKYGVKPGSLMIELTESGFLEANEKFLSFCAGLKQYGIPLALDDFGTGYSNFRYLSNLCPHTLKIDRSFTLKALQNDYEYNLLQHMADLTRSINTKFCIEGIETNQELHKICGIKPDYIQGYYFGKPCAYHEFVNQYIDRPIMSEQTG
jgi:diguanylate cyclase (GGDEF)-like protein